jgi:hypothetical protein
MASLRPTGRYPPDPSAEWIERKALYVADCSVLSTRVEDHPQYHTYLDADDHDHATAILASLKAALSSSRVRSQDHAVSHALKVTTGKALYEISNRGDCLQTQCVLSVTPPSMRCQYSFDQYRAHGLHLRHCAVQDLILLIAINRPVWNEVFNEMWDVVLNMSDDASSKLCKKALRQEFSISDSIGAYKDFMTNQPLKSMQVYLEKVVALQSTYSMRLLVTATRWIIGMYGVRLTVHTCLGVEYGPESLPPPDHWQTCYKPYWPFDQNIQEIHLVLMCHNNHFLALIMPEWESQNSEMIRTRSRYVVSVTLPSSPPPPRNP